MSWAQERPVKDGADHEQGSFHATGSLPIVAANRGAGGAS